MRGLGEWLRGLRLRVPVDGAWEFLVLRGFSGLGFWGSGLGGSGFFWFFFWDFVVFFLCFC